MSSGAYFLLGLLLLLSILGILTYLKIKRALRRNPGVSSLLKAVNELESIEEKYNSTPKSITKGESIFLPQITRKYPNFDAKELEMIVRNTVRGIYTGQGLNEEYTISPEVLNLTNNQEPLGSHMTLHDIGMSKYHSTGKKFKTIEYQVAFEASGKQYKVEVEMALSFDKNISHLRCKNCGGPLDASLCSCEYCKSQITVNTVYLWTVNKVNGNKII